MHWKKYLVQGWAQPNKCKMTIALAVAQSDLYTTYLYNSIMWTSCYTQL